MSMAAAVAAADIGGDVMVLDEQKSPGGQIYRGVLQAGDALANILGDEYRAGRSLADTLVREAGQGKLRYERAATVWRVDPDGALAYSVAGVAHQVRARHIILATGALERAVPLPGWTLPGAMTAGAAQIMNPNTQIPGFWNAMFRRFAGACATAGRLSGPGALLVAAFIATHTMTSGPAGAQDYRIKLVSGRTTATVKVAKGKPRTVQTDLGFSEIVVGDPEIATVSPLTDQSFYVLGKAVGTTGIALFDKSQTLVGMESGM